MTSTWLKVTEFTNFLQKAECDIMVQIKMLKAFFKGSKILIKGRPGGSGG